MRQRAIRIFSRRDADRQMGFGSAREQASLHHLLRDLESHPPAPGMR
jgi:hypothetical protein